jgi:hypothetical protein
MPIHTDSKRIVRWLPDFPFRCGYGDIVVVLNIISYACWRERICNQGVFASLVILTLVIYHLPIYLLPN